MMKISLAKLSKMRIAAIEDIFNKFDDVETKVNSAEYSGNSIILKTVNVEITAVHYRGEFLVIVTDYQKFCVRFNSYQFNYFLDDVENVMAEIYDCRLFHAYREFMKEIEN